jgi:ComEC/Rec2-related protein
MNLSGILVTALSPRGQAVLRRDFPLLHPAISMLTGQFIAFLAPSVAFLLSILFPAVAVLAGRYPKIKSKSGLLHLMAGFFLLGVLTYSFTVQSPKNIPKNSASHILKVTDEPRFSRPGLMDLSIIVLASRTQDGYYNRGSKNAPPRFRCKAVHLPWKNAHSLKEGSLFAARAVFRPFLEAEKQSSYLKSLARKGFSGTCTIDYAGTPLHNPRYLSSKRQYLRETVSSILEKGENAGLILSMSFGQKDLITRGTEEAFRRTGLSHLLVVSGYHVALIFGVSFVILKFLFLRINFLYQLCLVPQLCAICSMLLTIFYVLIVGSSGSSIRAACAISFLMMARLLERGGGMLNAFWLSIILILLVWPGSFLDLGIQLTYSSLLGIYLGLSSSDKTPIRRLTASWKSRAIFLKSTLFKYLKVCTWATTTSSIFVLIWLNYFSFAGYFTNPLLAPIIALVSCKLGAIAVIITALGIDSNGYFLKLLSPAVSALKELVIWISNFEYASIKPEGLTYWSILGILVFISLRAICFRVKLYFLNQGIWQNGL